MLKRVGESRILGALQLWFRTFSYVVVMVDCAGRLSHFKGVPGPACLTLKVSRDPLCLTLKVSRDPLCLTLKVSRDPLVSL